MLVKFFRHGTGDSKGVMDYMLGKDGKRYGSRVLEGSRQITSALIDSNPFKNRYKSGVLSFEEKADTITEEKKKEIMKGFERTILPGLEREQYNILWIEHTDKNGRLELNFIIPRQELKTGKAINPYYHAKDEKRVNAWKNIVNIENKYSDPTDPYKHRMSSDYSNYKPDQLKKKIATVLMQLRKKGYERPQIVGLLQRLTHDGEHFTIERQSKNSITVSHPSVKSNKNRLRLTGYMFERDYYQGDLELDVKKEVEDHGGVLDLGFEVKKKGDSEQDQYNQLRHFDLIRQSKKDYISTMATATAYNLERYTPKPTAEPTAEPKRPTAEPKRPTARSIRRP